VLASPGNQHIIRLIKTSITAGIRPCAMIFHVQPDTPWEPYDFSLLEAYQILQDETCPKCGQPVWLCRSTDNRIEFKVEETVCYATRAIEEKNARKEKKNKKISADEKHSWGLIQYAVPFVPENIGAELPTRKDFYESLTKK